MSRIKYTVLVTGPAYGTQNSSTAFLFCKSLIKLNHILNSIFFYCDGVYNANRMIDTAIDDFNLLKSWQDLNIKYDVKLYVCSSAASRRGIVEEENNSLYNKEKGNLASCFEFSGLIEWADSIKKSDRLIQF